MLCEIGEGGTQPLSARATAFSAEISAVIKPVAIAAGTSCEMEASTSLVAPPPIQAETFRPMSFRRLVRLAFLAPDIQQRILAGRQPPGMNLEHLMAHDVPRSWKAQRQRWGITEY